MIQERRHRGRGKIALFIALVLGISVLSEVRSPAQDAVPTLALEVSRNLSEATRRGFYRPPGDRRLAPRLERRSLRRPRSPVLVWVFLTDKGVGTEDSYRRAVEAVHQGLTPRARHRRANLGEDLGIRFTDIPVYHDYVTALREQGHTVRRVSRWLNAVSVRTTADRLPALTALPFVRYVQPVLVKLAANVPADPYSFPEPPPGLHPRGAAAGFADSLETEFYGDGLAQLEQIEVLDLHRMGYSGAGVTVMMLDTGFRKDHPVFDCVKLIAEWDFVNEDGNTQNEGGDHSNQHDHGTGVWGTLGGFAPGDLIGPAFAADFIVAKTEDITQEVHAEEDNYVAALEWGDSLGVDVTSSSLAYLTFDDSTEYALSELDGNTAVITVAVDIAAAKGIACINSASNNGPADTTIWTPADADTIISVGAVNSSGNIASFSSRGPTADGRIKPEICARGVSTRWARAATLGYGSASGTSLSAPLIGGLVALLKEAHPTWTGYDLREALIQTGSQTTTPDNALGYGIARGLSALTHNAATPQPPRMTLPMYLLSPGDSVFVSNPFPTLVWSLSAAANAGDTATYTLIHDDNAGFTTPDTVLTGTDTTYTFPVSIPSGKTVWWRVEATGNQGYVRKTQTRLFTVTTPVSVRFPVPENPARVFSPAMPNPTRARTTFAYQVPEGETVTLEIVSVTGRLVRRFVGEGSGERVWDGRDTRGNFVPAGVYFYRMAAGPWSRTRKLVRLP